MPPRDHHSPGAGHHRSGGDDMGQRICVFPDCGRNHYGRDWCAMHYRRWLVHGDPSVVMKMGPRNPQRRDVAERFWEKVNKRGPVPDRRPDLGPCWMWLAGEDGHGYGKFHVNKRRQKAYRIAYQLVVGPIPDGLQLDHLCRVRMCVNPAHLEAVTQRENIMRGEGISVRLMRGEMVGNRAKTHCPKGHPYDEENTGRDKKGRYCKECGRRSARERQRRLRRARPA